MFGWRKKYKNLEEEYKKLEKKYGYLNREDGYIAQLKWERDFLQGMINDYDSNMLSSEDIARLMLLIAVKRECGTCTYEDNIIYEKLEKLKEVAANGNR